MATKTVTCLSFIVLNNFFANLCVKKNCAHVTALNSNEIVSFQEPQSRDVLNVFRFCL